MPHKNLWQGLALTNVARGEGADYQAALRQSRNTHLPHLQRDGVDRSGEQGKLYEPELDDVDGGEFTDRCEGDRHQFPIIVLQGDGVFYMSPSGGGYGNPLDREPSKVLDDVLDDLIDVEHARDVYGVVLMATDDSYDWRPDLAATEKRRAEMRR